MSRWQAKGREEGRQHQIMEAQLLGVGFWGRIPVFKRTWGRAAVALEK